MNRYTSEETLPAITLDELLDALDGLDTVSEPRGIPFPQANSLDRVIDLCISLDFRNSDKDRIAEDYKVPSIVFRTFVSQGPVPVAGASSVS